MSEKSSPPSATRGRHARLRALFEAMSRRDPKIGNSDWDEMSEEEKDCFEASINEAFPVSEIAPIQHRESAGDQQAQSWLAVCELLGELVPEWRESKEATGELKALAAIRALASVPSATRDGAPPVATVNNHGCVVAAFLGPDTQLWQGMSVCVTQDGTWWVWSGDGHWVKDLPSLREASR